MLYTFIGYDAREDLAYRVCRHSLVRRASAPVFAFPLAHRALREVGIFSRPWDIDAEGKMTDRLDGKPFSTEFAFTRFLVPELCRRAGYKGWALFVDCDFLFLDDIYKMLALCDPTKALMVVPHEYKTTSASKMDGQPQQDYSRKLWSALMFFNMAHPSNSELGVSEVNTWEGSKLHRLGWLLDSEIGYLPEKWHWLNTRSPTLKVEGPYPPNAVSAIHYTEGGPWMPGYENCRMAETWKKELAHYQAANEVDRLPAMRVGIGA